MSRTTKRVITIVACVFACVFITSLVGSFTNGFEDLFNPSAWGAKEANPDNFIKVADYSIKTHSETCGVDITVTDNGEIKVKGENKSTENFTIEICKVKLPAGEYTFTSGAYGVSASKYYLKAGEFYADINENTFTLDVESELAIVLTVVAGEKINTTFSPVIVAGKDAGSFYA